MRVSSEEPDLLTANGGNAPHVGSALLQLLLHPYRTFILSWNWKTASLSAMMRAPIFLFSTLRSGWQAISVAVAVEAVYSAAISGCYGAFAQKLRRAHPLWLSGLLITVAAPAALLWLDYLAHFYTGTPNLRTGILASAIFAALSSLFNWYLMLHGNLLVGAEGRSFGVDLKQLPRRVLGFAAYLPAAGWRFVARRLHSGSRR